MPAGAFRTLDTGGGELPGHPPMTPPTRRRPRGRSPGGAAARTPTRARTISGPTAVAEEPVIVERHEGRTVAATVASPVPGRTDSIIVFRMHSASNRE